MLSNPLAGHGVSMEEVRHMMALACQEVDREPYIEVKTRVLDAEECADLHTWLIALPHATWSDEDRDNALKHFLESRQALISLPAHLTREATYCKVKWG